MIHNVGIASGGAWRGAVSDELCASGCPLLQELLVSPYLLERENIPVVRMVQHPGEFVINLPGVPHMILAAHKDPAQAVAVVIVSDEG